MRGMHKFIRGMCRATFTQMPALPLPQSLPALPLLLLLLLVFAANMLARMMARM